MAQWIDEFLRQERLPSAYRRTIETVHRPLAQRIAARSAQRSERVLTVGICGPQGSGKSTLVRSVTKLLEAAGLSAPILSLDDLYFTRDERSILAQRVHPLLRTRGVPGTHDVPFGQQVVADLRGGCPAIIPSFDKSQDERRPRGQWIPVTQPVDVILFEGWCVGVRPQSAEALAEPINELERDEDPDGVWRRYVNDQIAGPYWQLFDAIDMLVLLQAPSFASVFGWRLEQEAKLRERVLAEDGDLSRVMAESELARFISHFERLTKHILEEMPARADVVLPCR